MQRNCKDADGKNSPAALNIDENIKILISPKVARRLGIRLAGVGAGSIIFLLVLVLLDLCCKLQSLLLILAIDRRHGLQCGNRSVGPTVYDHGLYFGIRSRSVYN